MLIDTHCHLEKKEYKNVDDMVKKIFKTDVKILIVSGYDVKSSIEAIKLAHRYDNVYATVGFHPHNILEIKETDYNYFDEWLKDSKVVGVGEIGLDYHYDYEYKDKQMEIFKKQIDIAINYGKPIIVHNRDASNDICDILKEKKIAGIIHCFNDNLDMATKFIGLGFLLGIGGIITFRNNKLKEVISNIGLDNIVLETDAPYLAPEPFRGKQNSSLNLPLIVDEVAKITNTSYEKVSLITTSNALSLFDLKPII